MQITELPLYALISIDFDAVYEHGPGALYSVFDVDMLQVDLPEALGPKQMVDVLVATSTSFCRWMAMFSGHPLIFQAAP